MRSLFVSLLMSAPAHAGGPVGLPEFQTETEALVAATSALFDAIEGERAPSGKRMTPVIQAPQVFTPARLDVDEPAARPLTQNGPVQHLTGYRITWYPVGGLTGAVDFMGTWDRNRNLVCGYLTWDLTDPARPVLKDVEASYVDVASLDRLSPEARADAYLEANCAFPGTEQNFAFFD